MKGRGTERDKQKKKERKGKERKGQERKGKATERDGKGKGEGGREGKEEDRQAEPPLSVLSAHTQADTHTRAVAPPRAPRACPRTHARIGVGMSRRLRLVDYAELEGLGVPACMGPTAGGACQQAEEEQKTIRTRMVNPDQQHHHHHHASKTKTLLLRRYTRTFPPSLAN